MSYKTYIGRTIAYHPIFQTLSGSIQTAIFLSQVIYWTERSTSGDGWFYKTSKEFEMETGLTRKQQYTARKALVDQGILTEKSTKDKQMYFKVEFDVLEKSLKELRNLICIDDEAHPLCAQAQPMCAQDQPMCAQDQPMCAQDQPMGAQAQQMGAQAQVYNERIHRDYTEITTEITSKDFINPNEKPLKPNSEKKLLETFGITGQLADDFILHRKQKKSPITKTALDGYQREAGKAGITLAEALGVAIERGWQGFFANWYLSKPSSFSGNGGQYLTKEQQREAYSKASGETFLDRIRQKQNTFDGEVLHASFGR